MARAMGRVKAIQKQDDIGNPTNRRVGFYPLFKWNLGLVSVRVPMQQIRNHDQVSFICNLIRYFPCEHKLYILLAWPHKSGIEIAGRMEQVRRETNLSKGVFLFQPMQHGTYLSLGAWTPADKSKSGDHNHIRISSFWKNGIILTLCIN
jgi:hypothetical protein